MTEFKRSKTVAQKLFKTRAMQLEKVIKFVTAKPEYASAVAPSYTWCREAIAQAAGFKNVSAFDRDQQDPERSAKTLERLHAVNLEYASRLISHLYAKCGMQVALEVIKELDLISRTEHGATIFPTIRTTEQPRGMFNLR